MFFLHIHHSVLVITDTTRVRISCPAKGESGDRRIQESINQSSHDRCHLQEFREPRVLKTHPISAQFENLGSRAYSHTKFDILGGLVCGYCRLSDHTYFYS